MSLFDKFEDKSRMLQGLLEASPRDPFSVSMDEMKGPTRAMVKGKEIVLAGTNNYLGLTFEESAVDAAVDAVKASGTGTTGSRFATAPMPGTNSLKPTSPSFSAINTASFFRPGYQANLGAISALAAPPHDVILIDADCHACIYDGCQLSGAETIRFRHNDPESLDKRLSRLSPDVKGKLVCLSKACIPCSATSRRSKEFVEVAHKHGAYLLLDEAHSFGVFGDHGQRRVRSATACASQVDFYTGTFSKSLASIGGFVASNHPELEYSTLFEPALYVFTASPSPANIAAASGGARRRSPRTIPCASVSVEER